MWLQEEVIPAWVTGIIVSYVRQVVVGFIIIISSSKRFINNQLQKCE